MEIPPMLMLRPIPLDPPQVHPSHVTYTLQSPDPPMLMFRPIPPDPPRIPASPMEISSDQPDPPTELSNQPEPVPAEANLDLITPPSAPPGAECRTAPPKRRRRYRPPLLNNRMHSVLRATGGQAMRVVLCIPEDEEQCPLTLSPISEDHLDFLPGVRFVIPLPEYTKLALPCGHGFGAMNILYHFARRDMRCPCCRYGFKDKLDVDCIPRHFRQRFTSRIQEAEREDRDELAASDEQVARALSVAVAPLPSISEVIGALPLTLSVYLHSAAAPDGPVTSLELNLMSSASPDAESEFDLVRPHPNAMPRGTTSFFLPIQGQRILNEQLRDGSVTSISLVVHTRSFFPEVSVSELARAGPFPVRECQYDVTMVISATNGTYFDVSTRHDPFHLQCLVWRISPTVHVHRPGNTHTMVFVLS